MLAAGFLTSLPVPLFRTKSSSHAIYSQPDILRLFDDPSEIVEIGYAYLNHAPEYSNAELLIQSIDHRLRYDNSQALDKVISSQVKKDFVEGDTIQLNGWILSYTEAQQCALYCLSNS